MTRPADARRWIRRQCIAVSVAMAVAVVGLVWTTVSGAQGKARRDQPPLAAATRAVEPGAPWTELTPAQRTALQPLEREWGGIEASQKRKWLELAARVPKMAPAQQTRIQDRMAAWARLTPQERGQARLRFQDAKQVPAQDRRARWNAYQALSDEEKQALARRAAPQTDSARRPAPAGTAGAAASARERVPGKSNIVSTPAGDPPPKSVAPTVVQARPGASTTLITKRPAPPWHQQSGLPKIAATPEFVDRATLLPQRGPQGAATRALPPVPDPEARTGKRR